MTAAFAATARQVPEPSVRRIDMEDLREAVQEGIADFKAAPTHMIGLGIIYPLVGLAAARHASGAGLVPMLYPLVAGLTLLGPVAALGLYEISRRREAGRPAAWYHAAGALRSPALFPVAALGAVLLAVFVAWLFVARMIAGATVGFDHDGPMAFLATVTGTPQGWALMLIGHAAGLVFAAFVLAISVVSFPLMLDRHVGMRVAVRASVRVVRRNPATMVAWGAFVALVLALASLPAFVGLAVAVPILGHATWHLYRRAIGPVLQGPNWTGGRHFAG
jgi:uncharacterized membrane protein